jgi:Flp pilus assembly protein CpaB
MIVAVVIMLTGIGGLIAYDYYIRPFVLAKSVVVAKEEIAENQAITSEMLAMARVPNDLVPTGAIFDPEDVLGKSALVTMGTGTMLTQTMVDMHDLYPREGEVIFPIPKEAIYAVNGSLRKQDVVDISLVQEQAKQEGQEETSGPIIEKARVVYARTEDNQSVKDTEKGDVNQRETATGRVAAVEILIAKEDRDMLIREIGKGNRLWIARVSK